jgi:hypothetical protein
MNKKTRAKKITEMKQPLTATAVFYLGGEIEYLKRAHENDPVVHGDGSIEKDWSGFSLYHMKLLEERLRRYSLAETQSQNLAILIQNFEAKYAKPEPPRLDGKDRWRLRRLIEVIEAVVTEDLSRRNFAELTPLEGILDYKKLLAEGAKGLLAESGKGVPQIVIHDLDEAIKCLSYGAPTASAMIGLRAVEGMVRELHRSITGTKSTKPWAQLLEEVKKDLENKGEQPPSLLGYLNYIRDIRNRADHPDQVFTIREAEQILVHVIYTIQEIQKL